MSTGIGKQFQFANYHYTLFIEYNTWRKGLRNYFQ
jgi:hypothetical protein